MTVLHASRPSLGDPEAEYLFPLTLLVQPRDDARHDTTTVLPTQDVQISHDLSDAAITHAKKPLHLLAMQLIGVHAPQYVEDFRKLMKACGLDRQWRCPLLGQVQERSGII